MNAPSSALTAEIKQISALVSANVPLQSMWMSTKGQIWTVIHKSHDGVVVLSRRGVTKHGRASSLLVGGYRRI